MEGPTTSVKTTTYKTSYESEYGDSGTKYQSQIYPRTTVINRTAYNPAGQQRMSRSVSYGVSSQPQITPGAFQTVTSAGVTSVKTTRDKEKKDMQDLNERFANYIEKVRFLEAQNRKLVDELNKLKERWGKETTAIKAMYETELEEARKVINDAEKEKAKLEIRVSSLEEALEEARQQLEELRQARITDRETIERQAQQLSDYEAEINLLRRRIEALENDREKDKKEIARLQDALNRARVDLDNETLNHIDAENRRQTLEEELAFIKGVHEQEMKELAALAYRDTTNENREFWKSEMAQALREIQAAYDEKLEVMKAESETFYNLKLQEFRTGATRQNMETVHAKEETKRLRDQVGDLRSRLAELEARNATLEAECERLRRELEDKEREYETDTTLLKNDLATTRAEMEAILKELQDLLDTKLGLELEIAAYRKLLEGEENRVGLRGIVESMMSSSTSYGQESMDEGESYSRTEDNIHVVRSSTRTVTSN